MPTSINLGPHLSPVSRVSKNGHTLHDAHDAEGKSLKWFESGLGIAVLQWLKGNLGADTHTRSYSHLLNIKQNETRSKHLLK